MLAHDFTKSHPRNKETISSGIKRGASSAADGSSMELFSELSCKRASSKSYKQKKADTGSLESFSRCMATLLWTHFDIKFWQVERWTKEWNKESNAWNLWPWLNFYKIHELVACKSNVAINIPPLAKHISAPQQTRHPLFSPSMHSEVSFHLVFPIHKFSSSFSL